MYGGGIWSRLSSSVWRLKLLGFGGVAVPVERDLKSGSCGGGAWRAAGRRLTGLGPVACGGVVDNWAPREKAADREGFAENRFWPFLWWVSGEGYFIVVWLFIECLFGLCLRCRGRSAPSNILEHGIMFLAGIMYFGLGKTVSFRETGLGARAGKRRGGLRSGGLSIGDTSRTAKSPDCRSVPTDWSERALLRSDQEGRSGAPSYALEFSAGDRSPAAVDRQTPQRSLTGSKQTSARHPEGKRNSRMVLASALKLASINVLGGIVVIWVGRRPAEDADDPGEPHPDHEGSAEDGGDRDLDDEAAATRVDVGGQQRDEG